LASQRHTQDKGGNEQDDVYAVPTSGGAPKNLTNTPDLWENSLLISPDGRAKASRLPCRAPRS
jgi:hypothetical protein